MTVKYIRQLNDHFSGDANSLAEKKKTKSSAVKKTTPGKKTGTGAKNITKKSGVKTSTTAGPRKKTVKKASTVKTLRKAGTGKRVPAGTRKTVKKSAKDQKETRVRKTKALLESVTAVQPEIKSFKSAQPVLSPEKEAAYGLAQRVAQLMLEKKAERVSILDVGKLTGVMDYFVIATGMADVHIKAIADHVIDELYKDGEAPHHVEGTEAYRWVLIDYIDVVAHIFENETRSFYDLERLWGDAEVIPVEDRG